MAATLTVILIALIALDLPWIALVVITTINEAVLAKGA
jgi:hypothetical protein